MAVDAEDRDPALHVVVPGGPESERSFNILLPEHVTVRAHGQSDAKHLYIYQPGLKESRRTGGRLEIPLSMPPTLVISILSHARRWNRTVSSFATSS